MKERVALYARVSSDRQARDGTIESQIAKLCDYVQANKMHVDPDMMFSDNGISGATLVRPALDALRDKALAGQVDKVIVLCPDRLARKSAHQLILIEEFAKLGVEICFTNIKTSDSPDDQLLLQIQGVISEYEREKFRERSRRGTLHKARAGKISVLHTAPYGYVYIKKGDAEDARYEIHAGEADVVRKIFSWYINDGLSLTGICRRLADEEVPTPKGGAFWQPATLHGILKNPAYAGRAAFGRNQAVERHSINKTARERNVYPIRPKSSARFRPESEWIAIKVPALVDEETFQRAKAKGIENRLYAPRNNRIHDYLLSRLAYCAECGYAVYGIGPGKSNDRRKLVYRCAGCDGAKRPEGKVCTQRPIRVEVVDEIVWSQVKRLVMSPDLVLNEYSQRLEKRANAKETIDKLLAKKNAEARCQEHDRQRLLDLYQSGTIGLEMIKERLEGIRTRLDRIASERQQLLEQAQAGDKTLQLVEQFEIFSKKLAHNLDDLAFDDKQKIVRLLVKRVAVDARAKKLTIQHVLPLKRPCQLHSAQMPSP